MLASLHGFPVAFPPRLLFFYSLAQFRRLSTTCLGASGWEAVISTGFHWSGRSGLGRVIIPSNNLILAFRIPHAYHSFAASWIASSCMCTPPCFCFYACHKNSMQIKRPPVHCLTVALRLARTVSGSWQNCTPCRSFPEDAPRT